jgi:hypothetical protein
MGRRVDLATAELALVAVHGVVLLYLLKRKLLQKQNPALTVSYPEWDLDSLNLALTVL